MIRKWWKRHAQSLISRQDRGDTLIEVMVALSVVGISLAAGIGLANEAARTGRSAQERTEALKVAESQVERAKAFLATNNTVTTGVTPFCMNGAGAPVDTSDPACDTVDGFGGDGLYTLSAQEIPAGSGSYQFDVTWDHVNSTDNGALRIYYRAGPL